MNYQIQPAPLMLQPYVRYFWTARLQPTAGSHPVVQTFVDDSSGIILLHSTHASPIIANGSALPSAFVHGQTTRPSVNFYQAPFTATGVVFHPQGLHQLFGLPAVELTNQLLELGAFLPGPEVRQLQGLESGPEQRRGLEQLLIKRLKTLYPPASLSGSCLQWLHRQEQLPTVEVLQQTFGVSTRQLERKFREEVGVSPRHYLKVQRFTRALHLLRTGRYHKLSDIAYELDYADQSHLIRHMKELSGYTPRQLARQLDVELLNLIVN
jgi:AraC-like DNA-binding protein